MENESEVVVTTTETGNNGESAKADDTKSEDTHVVETPEAKRARLIRQLDSHNKKYGFHDDEEKVAPKAKKTKTDELDYAQLAFYNTKSDSMKIESDDEIDFLKQQIQSTGKTQKEILDSNWFKVELKERRDAKSVAKATPSNSGSRQAEAPAETKVDYWIAKKELPQDKILRQAVVERKIELARQGKL